MGDLYRITCLTPVHVGSGQELVRDIDFFSQGLQTYVLDPERLIGSPVSGLAEALVARKSIADVLRNSRIDPGRFTRYAVDGCVEAQRIRVSLCSADGRPMLPGSSLKGALRTLLLVGWAGNGTPHASRSTAAQTVITTAVRARGDRERSRAIDDGFFRSPRLSEPQGDVLRGLKVSDAVFGADELTVASSVAIGTTRNTLTAAESLRTGAAAVVRLIFSGEPLLNRLAFPHPVPSWAELAAWSRAHAQHLLRADQSYFTERSITRPGDRCAELLKQLDAFPRDAVVLRLAWGTGWRTMTGDLLTAAERDQVMRRVGKTRKVIVEGHTRQSRPVDVFGWIRLDPISENEARSLFVPPIGTKETVAEAVPSAFATPAPSPAAPIGDPFLSRLRTFKASEYSQLPQLIAQIAHRANRDECLRLLAARLLELYGADKKQLKRLRADYPALAPYLVK